MTKTFTRLTFAAIALTALAGTASARDVRSESRAPSAAATGRVDDVRQTGAIGPRFGVPTVATPAEAADLQGTLHLFGPRTDATPY